MNEDIHMCANVYKRMAIYLGR